MHIGFSSMNTLRDPHPATLGRLLEERGFESLWYGEHSHIPVSRKTPYIGGGELPQPYKEMMDPYVSLMAAASATTTLRLGTGIALLMERDIFSQAKLIATLDQLSGGRVIVGTGVGWNQEEFSNVCPHPWERRYAVLRETVAALRALWRHGEAGYQGEFVRFDPVWSLPVPAQAGGPRVYFGTMGPLGIRHAAQWADGWMPVDFVMGDVDAAVRDFRKLVGEQGREPASIEITIQAMVPPNQDTLFRYRDLGVHRVTIGVSLDLWDRPDAVLPMIDRYGEMIGKLQC